MNKTIAIIKGDGIGPEIVTEAMGILDAVAAKFGHTFTYVDAPMGGNAIDKFGVPLPDSSLATCRGADSVLLGAVGGPKWDNQPAANRPERGLLKLREGMGLYTNVRPAKMFSELSAACPLRADIAEGGIDFGVVRELTARGHEVRYYSYEPMRTLIEAAGAQFVACDPYHCEQHLTPADGARVGKDIAFSTHILVETTLALDEMVCAGMRAYAPDCIVADSMAVWGKAVAKKLGIPFISSPTTFAFNRYSAKVMKQSGGQMLKMMLAMPKINHDLQRLRDRGYPIKNILDIIQNDDRTDTIVYTSPEFQPCADTFSDKYAFVGPSIRPATETVEKVHDVLIYISMGTVNNDLLPFYRACIAAFADSPYQVILSTGEQLDSATIASGWLEAQGLIHG